MSTLQQAARGASSDQELEEAILFALKGLRFGSVEIIVHDSRVVQIERKEKMRMGGRKGQIQESGLSLSSL